MVQSSSITGHLACQGSEQDEVSHNPKAKLIEQALLILHLIHYILKEDQDYHCLRCQKFSN